MPLSVFCLAQCSTQALAMHATITLEWTPETHLNEAVGENVSLTQSVLSTSSNLLPGADERSWCFKHKKYKELVLRKAQLYISWYNLSNITQFMLGHLFTPFPIFQCFSFEYLSTQPKWPGSESEESNLRGHILLSMHSELTLPICLHLYIYVTNYNIVRGAIVPASILIQIKLTFTECSKKVC
jgi:hypothetical protein